MSNSENRSDPTRPFTHIPKVPVKDLDITVDNLERDELVVSRGHGRDKEEGGVAAVDDLCVWAVSEGLELRCLASSSRASNTRLTQSSSLFVGA
jgi:hypothetical protein